MMPRRVRNIPMKKLIPNMITCGNMLCGMLSLVLSFHGAFVPAAWLVYMAVVFDFLDGKMARKLGGISDFGSELDSLADVISFGVAPAMIFYGVYLKGFLGVGGALAAAFFAVCGALRLARFNVQHSSGPFEGLPIPGAGHFLVSFVVAGWMLHPLVAVIAALGTGVLMISNVPFGNLKTLRKGYLNRGRAVFLWGLAFTLIIVLREKAPLAGISIYLVSGFAKVDWGKWLSLAPEEEEPEPESDLHI